MAEQKEDRGVLSKWGNELRQSFRTIATVAGVSEFDARLLMNHAIPGVNAGYITRHKLLEDHLRSQQQAISTTVFGGVGTDIIQRAPFSDWLAPGAAHRAIKEAMVETKPSSVRSNRLTTQEILGRRNVQIPEPGEGSTSVAR